MSDETVRRLGDILESAFVATFATQLIPGIIHNFANPLNGIMGRAQIMKRRLDHFSTTVKENDPNFLPACLDLLGRLGTDVASINSEADRFCHLFQNVGERFQRMQNSDEELFSLVQLIASELHFADNYLDFKHHIRKAFQPNENIPLVRGNPAYYSLCIWALLRQVVLDAQDASQKTLSIKTTFQDGCVTVQLRNGIATTDQGEGTKETSVFRTAVNMLEAMGAKITMDIRDGFRVLTLIIKI